MMARPQNSPKGLFSKNRIDVGANQITGNSTALLLSGGVRVSGVQMITGNSTAVVFGEGVRVSDAQTLTGNSTGLIHADSVGALPGNVAGAKVIGVIDLPTTGIAVFINTTGTTYKYLSLTSVFPS